MVWHRTKCQEKHTEQWREGFQFWRLCSLVVLERLAFLYSSKIWRTIGGITKIIGIANLKVISAGACLTFLWRTLLMGFQIHTWSFPLQPGLYKTSSHCSLFSILLPTLPKGFPCWVFRGVPKIGGEIQNIGHVSLPAYSSISARDLCKTNLFVFFWSAEEPLLVDTLCWTEREETVVVFSSLNAFLDNTKT